MLIIIASDSRGRGFDQFLQKAYPFPSNWKLSLICRPGGPIERLRKEVELTQKSMSKVLQTHIGFFAGICNFTKKIKHAHGTEQLFNTFKVHSKRNQFHLVFNYSPQFPLKNSKNINSKGDLCKAVNFLLKTPSLSKYVLRMILEKSF